MRNAIFVVDDPLFQQHQADIPHPERPERLEAARTALDRLVPHADRHTLDARDATDDELSAVHTQSYVEQLAGLDGSSGYLDADTFYGPQSVRAARRAAGGCVALIDALLQADAAALGLALVRPPGHHARPSGAMGFCLLNNVAVAARHARQEGAERVAIFDWDVHHGNGTEETFWNDPSILYLSIHQSPFYPGTGAATDVGGGEGTGSTLNVPLPAGSGDAAYAAAMARLVGPVLEQFAPSVLLISAGFDAHRDDPLANMRVSPAGFASMLRAAAAATRNVPIGLILEGGYGLPGLADSLAATLGATLDAEAEAAAKTDDIGVSDDQERALKTAAASQRSHWKLD